jgi:hypothetical protein
MSMEEGLDSPEFDIKEFLRPFCRKHIEETG